MKIKKILHLTTDKAIRLKILGCQATAPTITANLESTTEVEKDLIVKATITNNGQSTNDFIITATGFESWANLVSVNPQSATITSGKSQEVTITLSPKTAGTQSFKINAVVDGETFNQPVSVRISEKAGMFSELGISNTMLYLIAGIVALLILIFIVLIVKLSRRPRKAEF